MAGRATANNSNRSTANTPWRRHGVGVAGLLLLGLGIYLYIDPPSDASGGFLHGSSVKSGLILLAAWLAFPQIDRMPILPFFGIILGLISVAVRPSLVVSVVRIGFFLVPIFVLIWVLRLMKKP